MSKKFVHLNVHSDYSIINGISKIELIVKKALDLNMSSIAITDLNNLFCVIKFYKLCHSYNIKPIIGVDLNLLSNNINFNKSKITILAMNASGYKNLILLLSEMYKYGYNLITGPVITKKILLKYNYGLIILSGGCNGEIGKYILYKNFDFIKDTLFFYKKYFNNRYYIELSRISKFEENQYYKYILEIALKYNLPVVATNNVRFINKKDFEAHEIKVAINKGYNVNSKKNKYYTNQQYIKDYNEMYKIFSDIPEALINTVEISKRCNVIIKLNKYFLPNFNTKKDSPERYLIKRSYKGLKKRLLTFHKKEEMLNIKYKYIKRLKNELYIINKMGFASYFLIVMEFVEWAKNNNIPVGPGRGSGAGSLVAYCLNITELDPINFDLLFERFLNLERISLPDFDIDFCMEKRDLVINHVFNVYGKEFVSQIITFGTMTAKAVIRDVGRALGYPYIFVNKISKLIPNDQKITLKNALSNSNELLRIYKKDEEVKILLNTSLKLEGVIRNIGKHAGGVVISPFKINRFLPIYCDYNGENKVTQFDKNDIEKIGLLKFDFLGLKTLTVISNALKIININRIKNNLSLIDIKNISLKDKKSFLKLKKGDTTAVFQLESNGIKDLIKRLKPDCFEDIIALIALFRPGPLQSGMVDNYINRKHGYETIYYPDKNWQHKILKDILKSTYGIILYQEQVMKIAQIFSGYTLGKADILRRAMSKKNPIEMEKQRKFFINGAKNKGIESKLAIKIFDLVEKFSGYGFNKSHSAAYALISYQTLWLKTNYPAEYMISVINCDIYNTDKIIILINESIKIGLKFLKPNINNGLFNFSIYKNNIINYGLGAIKGIGKESIKYIIDERKNNGLFKNIFDFCKRINIKKISRRSLEKLILSGSFDCFNIHRAALLKYIEDAIKISNQYFIHKKFGQADMFGISNDINIKINNSKNIPELEDEILLDGEINTIGLYMTKHPIDKYEKEINSYKTIKKIKDIKLTEHKEITIFGVIINIKFILDKKSNKIAICTIDDKSGRLELILFDNILNLYNKLIKKNNIIIPTGNLNKDSTNNKIKMIVKNIITIDNIRKKTL